MLATTSFVTTAVGDLQTALNDSVNGKAPINNPTFTGAPAMTVSPDLADYSKKIPTTEWVKDVGSSSTFIKWQGSARTISTSGPSGGADGDFWFQI